jgi:pimeloyl-ACP methyl ester carboxylesterase
MKSLLGALLVAIVPIAAAAQNKPSDQWLTRPVDDATFKTYLNFFAYDQRLAFDLKVLGSEDKEGVHKEHLVFQTTPGVKEFANLYRASGAPAQKAGAVIFLHGGSPLGKDGKGPQAFCEFLARGGWTVLALDLPYFGERSTDLFTTFTDPEKHERLYNQPSAYLSWVTQVVKDVGRSLDLLVGQRNVDAKRVALVGLSRGAIVGTIAGGADKRFAGVALLYGGHFDALEREHLPAACPANYIVRIAPRPLLMINGTEDTDMIKDPSVLPLYKIAKMPKKMIMSDTGHAVLTEDHRSAILQWLRETLR